MYWFQRVIFAYIITIIQVWTLSFKRKIKNKNLKGRQKSFCLEKSVFENASLASFFNALQLVELKYYTLGARKEPTSERKS
jgi:hypothetical protein